MNNIYKHSKEQGRRKGKAAGKASRVFVQKVCLHLKGYRRIELAK